MTFTYDLTLADTDLLAYSKIRLEIGDTIEDDGVLPQGRNFSDEELAVFYDNEGHHVMRAAAAALEAAAARWARFANISIGPRREDLGKVADTLRAQAQAMRRQYGYGNASGAAGLISAGVIRVDGYSNDVASDGADAESGEYAWAD